MKSVGFFIEETTKRRIVQIDMDTFAKDPEAIRDFVDVIKAESREHEPTISLDAYFGSTNWKRKR